jgi:hypothetical protein
MDANTSAFGPLIQLQAHAVDAELGQVFRKRVQAFEKPLIPTLRSKGLLEFAIAHDKDESAGNTASDQLAGLTGCRELS